MKAHTYHIRLAAQEIDRRAWEQAARIRWYAKRYAAFRAKKKAAPNSHSEAANEKN